MNKNIEMMRKLVEQKKQKSGQQRGLGNKAEKDTMEKNRKVGKQLKKGGLFDGK